MKNKLRKLVEKLRKEVNQLSELIEDKEARGQLENYNFSHGRLCAMSKMSEKIDKILMKK